MSVTLAERLSMQNSEIHRELDEARGKLPRLYIADIMDAVERGERYKHPENIGTATKKTMKKLERLNRRKERMDF